MMDEFAKMQNMKRSNCQHITMIFYLPTRNSGYDIQIRHETYFIMFVISPSMVPYLPRWLGRRQMMQFVLQILYLNHISQNTLRICEGIKSEVEKITAVSCNTSRTPQNFNNEIHNHIHFYI